MEFSEIFQNSLILSFGVVKNMSVHFKELFIKFEVNSLGLVLVFKVLKIKAFG
jgi:hypothetical protein